MFKKSLLDVVRTDQFDTSGPVAERSDGRDFLTTGEVRSQAGEVYTVRDGYLDLIGTGKTVADNIANLTNYLPGAGSGYEPLWRVRSLSLLSGEKFTNEREMDLVFDLARLGDGTSNDELFLDLGCSAGLYTRNAAKLLGKNAEGNTVKSGDIIGLDIAPSMLKEAVRKSGNSQHAPSFVRADAKRLPFADGVFSGALCGGSLNEFGDPAHVMRETARVLKPGGRLAVMGILRAGTGKGRALQSLLSTGGISFFEPEEIVDMLEHSGFEVEPLITFGSVFFAGASRAG